MAGWKKNKKEAKNELEEQPEPQAQAEVPHSQVPEQSTEKENESLGKGLESHPKFSKFKKEG